MKTFKKALAVVMCVVMTLTAAPLSGFVGLELPEFGLFGMKAEAASYSGKCGDNLTWSLDTAKGKLVISGTGDMYNWYFTSYEYAPWYSYRSSIKTVVIGDSVTSIGQDAFYYCKSLTSITIPDSVTSIDERAFYDCTGLTSITIPDSVTSIGGLAFSDCTGLTSVYYTGDIAGWCSIKFGFSSSNPIYYAKNLYIDNEKLEELVIPDSVTSIGNYAFSGFTSLTSVTIPDSVKSIGDWAFRDCTGLTSITIPDSVTSIDERAFYGCTGLTSVTIPDSVTSIGEDAFAYCSSLTSITVDANNKNYSSNSDGVLFNKDKTTLVQYPIGNTRISYTIPESVTSIGDYAFYYCKSLTSITITDNVTTIGDCAFHTCSGIKELKMPVSAKIYGRTTFKGCTSIEKVILTKGTGVMQSYTVDTYSISDNYYGNTPWYISGCKVVIIEDGVRNIGKYAFAGCDSLVNITIPNSIQVIRDYAFCGCDSLSDVYYNSCSKSWAQKEICSNNTDLTNATIHYAYYYIKWINDGVTTEDRIKVGDSIVVPADPKKDYYTFTGWNNEIPDVMPESNLTFTAQLVPITYYADFVIDGETIASIPYTVETESIEEPLLPEKAEKPGYTYGWEKYELTPGGITVNAAYTANPHTVTWVIDGEEKIVDDYGYGDEIVKLADPKKEGHTFTGWDKEIASTVPDEDLVYTATWKKNSYTVKWNIDGVITEEPYDYGDEIAVPENPSKDGMFFTGWGAVVPETMPGKNLEFTAQWNKTNFEYEKDENGNITITGAKNAVGDVEIPDNINGYPVTAIAEAAFAGSNITSVTIPAGVETIGECAFAYCENLKAVNIPASVSKLGETAFVGSTNIEKIDIPADNESYATDEYGVIYNKDFTLLIYAPAKSVGEAYTMHSTTATACELSFADCTDFALTLSDGFSADSSGMFFDILSVTGFVTGKNCVNYKAIDGVLYNKAVTTLIKYPVDSKRDLLIPPASVEYIADEYAFVTPEVEKSVIALFGLDYDSNTFANMYREPEYLTVHIDSFYDFDSESHVFLMMGPSHVCFGDTTKSENDQLNEIADNAIANIESQWEEKKDELTPGSIEYYYNEAFVLGYVDLITSYIDCQNDHTRLHKYAQIVETKDPTCAVDGYVNYDCDCGYEFTDVITAPGHNYESVVTNVTCTTDGYTTHTCSVCKDTYTDSVVKAEGHKYDSVVTPNTCTKDGYTTHTCSVCEDTYTDSETKATGHSHESKVTKEPTCTNTGIRTFTCHCGDSYTEVIKANGHTKGEWAYIGGKEYAKSCTVCGDKLESKIVTVDMFFNSENVNKKQVLNKSTATVTATVTDNFVNDLVFASSDSSTVSVDANGNVVANNIGKATITVTIKGTAISDSIEVEVLPRDFTVTWNVNGKQTKQTVKEEAKFTPNVNTTLKGYKFIGWDKTVPTTMPAENLTFTAQYELIVKQLKIKNPSTSTINYGETLVMHADFGGVELPEGWTIQWTVEGAGFNMAPAADGLTCKMTSVANGNATVKATLVDENGEAVLDADGNEMSDSKQLTSKAGFWQKFVSFFKKIFGISRVILQSI